MNGRLLGFVALLTGILGGCEFGNSPGGGTGVDGIAGILVDSKGSPAANVKVRVYPEGYVTLSAASLSKSGRSLVAGPESTVTDAKGRFRFARLADGRYNVQSSRVRGDTTYAVFIRNVTLVKSLDLGTDTLRAAGGLRITVRDIHQFPLSGALCYIAGSPWAARSNEAGVCVLQEVASGEQIVTLTAGPRSLTFTVQVLEGRYAEEDAVLSLRGSYAIPADWIETPATEGFTFRRPPDVDFLQEQTPGYFLYESKAQDPSFNALLRLDLRTGSAFDPIARPVDFPEYSLDTIPVGNNAFGILISYRVPDSEFATYGNGPMWISGLEVKYFDVPDTDVQVPFLGMRIVSLTAGERDRALKMLRSVHWSKGPALLPPVPAPLLSSPTVNATEVNPNGPFSWSGPGSDVIKYYRLQVSTDSLFTTLAANDSARGPLYQGGVQRSIPKLGLQTRYYWRVIAVSLAGSVSVSRTRSFVTRAPRQASTPVAASPYSPAWGETEVSLNPTVSWSGGGDSYQVQIAKDIAFEHMVYKDTGWGQDKFDLVEDPYVGRKVGPLAPNTLYYWRVIGTMSGEIRSEPSTSRTQTFTTMPERPAAPAILAPENGAVNLDLSPMLSWSNAADDPILRSNRVQLATDSAFSALVVNDSHNASSVMSRAVGPLKPGTRYFWRVRAVGATEEAYTTSGIRSFTTKVLED